MRSSKERHTLSRRGRSARAGNASDSRTESCTSCDSALSSILNRFSICAPSSSGNFDGSNCLLRCISMWHNARSSVVGLAPPNSEEAQSSVECSAVSSWRNKWGFRDSDCHGLIYSCELVVVERKTSIVGENIVRPVMFSR